ncbi:hypothetical protein ABEB36_004786 [Hypothenemus hampei]|uniref:Uncharacterized protein n=1 Tax=Hypothenemus hampei TaxID=57062 RepID=A0ABD1EVX3_HYPHA
MSSNGTIRNTSNNQDAHPYKVIVVGDSNVGKTTLTYRFCEGEFRDKIEATIGVDVRKKTIKIDEEAIVLQLWDTAGQERFRKSMCPNYYRNADAIVFIYDVTSPSSFTSLKKWVDEADINCLFDVPRVLVGNKCDHAMTVSRDAALKFADQHNMPFFETSARLDSNCDNVESIFVTLAHKLKNGRRFSPNSNPDVVTLTATVIDETSNQRSCCFLF